MHIRNLPQCNTSTGGILLLIVSHMVGSFYSFHEYTFITQILPIFFSGINHTIKLIKGTCLTLCIVEILSLISNTLTFLHIYIFISNLSQFLVPSWQLVNGHYYYWGTTDNHSH